jgi:channel protein (hemolysin III family)
MPGNVSVEQSSTQRVYSLPGVYEPFSAISHLAGAVLFVFLGRRLLQGWRGDTLRRSVLGVYVGSCVLLFSLSAAYHIIPRDSPAKALFGRLDHSAIFVLIAGTFTPVHGIAFRGWSRWLPLFLIWAAALAGITLKVIYFRQLAEWFSLAMYLFLGWLGALSGSALALRHGFGLVKPALWGGIAYSIGAILEFWRWPVVIPGVVQWHEMFHIAVLIGAVFHWTFIRRITRL